MGTLEKCNYDKGYFSWKNKVKPETNFNAISELYKGAGYELPKLVFWNLNGRLGNVPGKFNEQGVALVSGFSPAILKSLLSAEIQIPEQSMLDTVMVDRYDWNKY